ncbi:MAG: GNAT family N-acetyltransferase [Bacteroidota bacterium]|nr:GNAT family N-acetyltransferase [Bacteroidota bacterium]
MSVQFFVEVASGDHTEWSDSICRTIEEAARSRGTGIALRTPAYISGKILEGKAVIALARHEGSDVLAFAGFCYIETWGGKKYVANSGLVVAPAYRHSGLAREIKKRAFGLSREKYPQARLFGITTNHAVMKINTDLGYVPVPFSELTRDDEFWNGCRSCPNYDILNRTGRSMCLCTAMLFDPEKTPRTQRVEDGKDIAEPQRVEDGKDTAEPQRVEEVLRAG